MNTVIGKNIRKIRIIMGINQCSLAEFLGVDQITLNEIEKGNRSISADLLDKIVHLFGISAAELVTENTIEDSLIHTYSGNELTAADMEAIYAINKIAWNLEEMNHWLKERGA